MVSNWCGIKVQGACFPAETVFRLFTDDKQRLSIVYGKNGSGKSSIAKSIRAIREDDGTFQTHQLIDFDQHNWPSEDHSSIPVCVFNDEFVQENVLFENDGLHAVVMFGKQVELEQQLNDLNQEKDAHENVKKKYDRDYAQTQDENSPASPKYYLNKMISALKSDGNWADQDKKFRNLKKKTPVTEDTVADIASVCSSMKESRSDIDHQLKETTDLYFGAKGGVTINQTLSVPTEDAEKIHIIDDLLKLQLDRPRLTGREKILLELIREGKQSIVTDARNTFSKEESSICPYCLQPVSEEWKNSLMHSIEEVLNPTLKKHQNDLSQIRIEPCTTDYTAFIPIDEDLVKQLENLVEKYNHEIENMKKAIELKKENSYIPVTYDFSNYHTILAVIKGVSNRIQIKQKKYNQNIKDVQALFSKVLLLLKQFYWFDIATDYQSYKKQKDFQKRFNDLLRQEQKLIDEYKAQITAAKQAQANITIARDRLNQYLEYIFFQKTD